MNMNAIDCKDSYLVTDDNGDIRFIAKNNQDKEILDILNKENVKERLLIETENLKVTKDNLKSFINVTPILHLVFTTMLLIPPIGMLFEVSAIKNILLTIIFLISGISLACIPLTIKRRTKVISK